MNNISYKKYTLYFYEDDLLGCTLLRHKYSPYLSVQALIRDFEPERVDITLNNLDFMVHPEDKERIFKILSK